MKLARDTFATRLPHVRNTTLIEILQVIGSEKNLKAGWIVFMCGYLDAF